MICAQDPAHSKASLKLGRNWGPIDVVADAEMGTVRIGQSGDDIVLPIAAVERLIANARAVVRATKKG